jgi:N-acylneuraminate cytidylyltransferase
MRTIALIPARAGSKGIPNKNLRLLGGKPLLEWSIHAAVHAACFNDIVVSAGSKEIEDVALAAGASAFSRPWSLGTDTTPMIQVVRHAVELLGLNNDDVVVLLQPTHPFRSVESIRECVETLPKAADSCMTVLCVPDRYHPDQIIANGYNFPVNRQDLGRKFVRAGTVYAFHVGTVRRHGDIYGELCYHIEVSEEEALNLDEMSDWYEAERRVKETEKDGAAKASRAPSVPGEEQAQQAAL